MRRFVEKGIFTKEHAKTLLDMIYAHLDFDLDPSLKTSHVGEIMRSSEVKVDTAIVSLTDIARTKSKTNPGYLIQSWLRSNNTIEFLRTWETKHNKDFDNVACDKLLEELHKCGLTMTPKLWCEKTRAKGLVSAKGKGGGTRANPEIALAFKAWLEPEILLDMIRVYRSNVSLNMENKDG